MWPTFTKISYQKLDYTCSMYINHVTSFLQIFHSRNILGGYVMKLMCSLSIELFTVCSICEYLYLWKQLAKKQSSAWPDKLSSKELELKFLSRTIYRCCCHNIKLLLTVVKRSSWLYTVNTLISVESWENSMRFRQWTPCYLHIV